MDQICVFCGSSNGILDTYAGAARGMGRALASRNIRLVYGGGKIGMMGILADSVLANGGQVTGVITQTLYDWNTGKNELDDLRVVPTMHDRKALMGSLAEGFIALPGGFGTFEELFEVLTWLQLGIHHHPVGLLNVQGYFDRLLDFLYYTRDQGFVKAQHLQMLLVDESPDGLLEQMEGFVYHPVSKV
jgi:uncharacterized protein (TIGR00730 family)